MPDCFPAVEQFTPPSVSEVLEIIVDLKNSTAGHDEISVSLVKEISSSILIPLTYICAKSMEQGIVPTGMKVAKIIPLFKSGYPSCFTNYNPISILPCFL